MYAGAWVSQHVELSWRADRCAWKEHTTKFWTIHRSVTSILGERCPVLRHSSNERDSSSPPAEKRKDSHMAIEERVQIAIDNWAPRFISNGVDPNDFQRVTKRIERWDDGNREWAASAAMHEQMGRQAEQEGNYQSAAYHYFHAAMDYHFGKYLFVQRPDE